MSCLSIDKYLFLVYGIEVLPSNQDAEFAFMHKMYDDMQLNLVDHSYTIPELIITREDIGVTLFISFENKEYILISLDSYYMTGYLASSQFPTSALAAITVPELLDLSDLENEFYSKGQKVFNVNDDTLRKVVFGFLLIHETAHLLSKKGVLDCSESVQRVLNKCEHTHFYPHYEHYLTKVRLFLDDNKQTEIEEIYCDIQAYEVSWKYFVFGWTEISPREHSLMILSIIKAISLNNRLNQMYENIDLFLCRETMLQIIILDYLENFNLSCRLYDHSENSNELDELKFLEISVISTQYDIRLTLPYFHIFNIYSDASSKLILSQKENHRSTSNHKRINKYLNISDNRDLKQVFREFQHLIDSTLNLELKLDEQYNNSILASYENTFDQGDFDDIDEMKDYISGAVVGSKLPKIAKLQSIFRNTYKWNIL